MEGAKDRNGRTRTVKKPGQDSLCSWRPGRENFSTSQRTPDPHAEKQGRAGIFFPLGGAGFQFFGGQFLKNRSIQFTSKVFV
jgi:hypothetical protein